MELDRQIDCIEKPLYRWIIPVHPHSDLTPELKTYGFIERNSLLRTTLNNGVAKKMKPSFFKNNIMSTSLSKRYSNIDLNIADLFYGAIGPSLYPCDLFEIGLRYLQSELTNDCSVTRQGKLKLRDCDPWEVVYGSSQTSEKHSDLPYYRLWCSIYYPDELKIDLEFIIERMGNRKWQMIVS